MSALPNPDGKTYYPRLIKNLGGSPSRKAFDFTLQGVLQVARPCNFGSGMLNTGTVIDPVALGLSEAQVRTLWSAGFVDWQ